MGNETNEAAAARDGGPPEVLPDLEGLTVVDLQERCRAHNLALGGNKAELIARLREALAPRVGLPMDGRKGDPTVCPKCGAPVRCRTRRQREGGCRVYKCPWCGQRFKLASPADLAAALAAKAKADKANRKAR